jgi:phosphopantothenoylcysteine synthetase/decarboxylase
MNRTMWEHPAVARNVATLRDDGIYVVEPSVGFAASDGRRACEPGGVAMGLGAGAAQVFTAIHQVARTKQRPSNGVSRRGVKQQADV